MTSKRHTCPTCSNGNSHPTWDATTATDGNGDEVTLWECRSCHAEMPRRTRKPSAKEQAQLDHVDDIIRSLGFDPSTLR